MGARTKNDIIVRPFAPADQPGARRVILAGMREHFGFVDRTLNPDLSDIATSYRDGVFLVAECRGVIVGTGALTLRGAMTAEVSRMSTAAAHRRRGVASAILRHLLNDARTRGCAAVVLGTNAEWSDALAFYRARGFSEVGRARHEFGVGVRFELRL